MAQQVRKERSLKKVALKKRLTHTHRHRLDLLFAASAAGGQQPLVTIQVGMQMARDAHGTDQRTRYPCSCSAFSLALERGWVPVSSCTLSPDARGVKAGGWG